MLEEVVRQPTPVKKKQTRSCKLTKEQSYEKLNTIFQAILKHVGQPALLYIKEGRDMVPYYVELVEQGHGITARYKCYGPDGKFRCYLNHFPSSIAIMTGEQKIIYFDDI